MSDTRRRVCGPAPQVASTRSPHAWRIACAIALPIALPVVFVATTGSAVAAPVTVRDDAGHTLTLAQPAQRVLPLSPHLTELAFAAGGEGRIVGVTRYSDHPAATRSLPVVGDAFALNFEAIARVKPDLVLVWGSGLNDRHKAQLRAMGLPVYESEVGSVDGIVRTLRTLGALMGTQPGAEAVASRLDAQWQSLRTRYAGRAPVRVFYQLWAQPLMTINREHVIGEVLRACGGSNAFADLPMLTPTVSWEAAVQSNPQLIVGAAENSEGHRRWQAFTQVDAVRHQRFAQLDGSLIGRMGPRFVQGAEQLCAAIDGARGVSPAPAQSSATQTPPTSRQSQP